VEFHKLCSGIWLNSPRKNGVVIVIEYCSQWTVVRKWLNVDTQTFCTCAFLPVCPQHVCDGAQLTWLVYVALCRYFKRVQSRVVGRHVGDCAKQRVELLIRLVVCPQVLLLQCLALSNVCVSISTSTVSLIRDVTDPAKIHFHQIWIYGSNPFGYEYDLLHDRS